MSSIKDVPSILDESKKLKKINKPKKLTIVGQREEKNPANTPSVMYPNILVDVFSDGSTRPATVNRKQEGYKRIQDMSAKEFGNYSLELGGTYVDGSTPKKVSSGMSMSSITRYGRR